jgi:hypothetical protein
MDHPPSLRRPLLVDRARPCVGIEPSRRILREIHLTMALRKQQARGPGLHLLLGHSHQEVIFQHTIPHHPFSTL